MGLSVGDAFLCPTTQELGGQHAGSSSNMGTFKFSQTLPFGCWPVLQDSYYYPWAYSPPGPLR